MNEDINIEQSGFTKTRLAVTGATIAISFIVLCYGSFFEMRSFGINFPLMVIIYYSCLKFILKVNIFKDYSYLIFIFLFSVQFAFSDNQFLLFLDAMLVFALIALHGARIFGVSKYKQYSFGALLDVILVYFGYPFAGIPKTSKFLLRSNRDRKAGAVFAGLSIGIVFMLIITGLLSSADEMFQSVVNSLFGDFGEIIFKAVIFAMVFIFSVCMIYGLKNKVINVGEYTEKPPSSFPTAMSLILIMTAIPVIAFSAIQIAGLLTPIAETYSNAAREGFFQLTAASALVFALILFSLRWGDNKKLIKIFCMILLFGILLMLIVAFYRMVVYESVYGLTRLRLYTQWFMILIAMLMIVVGIKVFVPKFKLAKWATLISLTAFLILSSVGVDRIIAIDTVNNNGDIGYLLELSSETVPYYQGKQPLPGMLEERLIRARSWQYFNVSREMACFNSSVLFKVEK